MTERERNALADLEYDHDTFWGDVMVGLLYTLAGLSWLAYLVAVLLD